MIKGIKNISVTLALVKLLSFGDYSLVRDNSDDYPNDDIVYSDTMLVNFDIDKLKEITEDGYSRYLRYDNETGEYRPVSIFDDVNVWSRQYGASQSVFRKNFDELISDKYIWDEMQEYFPVSGFETEEEALYFYSKYFTLISNNGCGYAAAADYVFHFFEGREREFEETFGFPMYTVINKQEIDFNYELFMLKFFNYSVINVGEKEDLVKATMLKDLYHNQLRIYVNSEEYKRELPSDVSDWTELDWDQWSKFDLGRKEKFDMLSSKYQEAENKSAHFGIHLDDSFGAFDAFLSLYGIDIDTVLQNNVTSYATDDIVASKGFKLYKKRNDGSIYLAREQVMSHYVYVSGITEEGMPIISSWGDKYYFDDSSAKKTSKVLIKVNE